jgi:hypothetical protein
VSSTGPPFCRVCENQRDLCEACGGRVLAPLVGPASVRGARWAENVIRALVARWPPRWPRSPRAVVIAGRYVADLAPRSVDLQARLARVCLDAAARRYGELTDFLRRKRYALVPGPDDPPGRDPLEGETEMPK